MEEEKSPRSSKYENGCGSCCFLEMVVIRWIFQNNSEQITSNVELAILSNISKSWRQAVKIELLNAIQTQFFEDNKTTTVTSPRLFSLLLPSMIRRIMVDSQQQQQQQQPLPQHNGTTAPAITDDSGGIRRSISSSHWDETFCAAWFASEGIQQISIQKTFSEDDNDDGDNDDDYYLYLDDDIQYRKDGQQQLDDAFLGGHHYRVSQQITGRNRTLQVPPQPFVSPSGGKWHRSLSTSHELDATTPMRTCPEWQGCQTAADILRTFGFDPRFVNDVLNTARQQFFGRVNHHHDPNNDNKDNNQDQGSHCLGLTTTVAVRGAVVARPESYCFCVEPNLTTAAAAAAMAKEATNDGNGSSSHRRRRHAIRKQKHLQRDVLPRVVTRTKRRLPTTSPLNPKCCNDSATISTCSTSRCVQFLNASGGHAVCMMTPPFACGPIAEPVTIVCVGIALEDGCFLSGLHHRFELGHLYPHDKVTEDIEMSRICIATERWIAKPTPQSHPRSSSTCPNNAFSSTSRILMRESDADGDDDDDDSSCDASERDGGGGMSHSCTCVFQGVAEKLAAVDEGTIRSIHRGRAPPGLWHCYVAIFDGDNSCIRVDGNTEPMEATLIGDCVDTSETTTGGMTLLDGLTIGSDHCFGMSLCCGDGSGGEGEGAIAEVAVFKGRLAISDIEAIENSLMQKHGIPSSSLSQTFNAHIDSSILKNDACSQQQWFDYDRIRQAEALITCYPMSEKYVLPLPQVPLRFLSQHKSVAWKRYNPVTGEPIIINRIGCKPGESSSDL